MMNPFCLYGFVRRHAAFFVLAMDRPFIDIIYFASKTASRFVFRSSKMAILALEKSDIY